MKVKNWKSPDTQKHFFYPMTRSFTFSVPKIIFLIVLQFGVLEGFTRATPHSGFWMGKR